MGDLPAPGVISCLVCGSDRASRLDLNGGRLPLYRCPDCRVVHWGHVWGSEKVVQYYHNYYAKKRPEYDPVTEKRYHAILDRFERMTRPGRLLDVGCGMGHFLAVAESRGWEAVGLEVSGSGLQLLARFKAEQGWRFKVHGEDLLGSDFPSASFRAVTMFEVLEHLVDPMANLRKVYTLLEQGGTLYLTTPNFDSLSRYALAGRWRAITPEHLYLFNPRTLGTCLDAAGFHPVRILTKNVDVPEIVTKWRRRRQPYEPANTFPTTRAFRRIIEDSLWLRWLKAWANAALRLSRLGETIEALAVKRSMA
ncbi:MAG: class I SAM-dependent methyltransferase [Dehalococcoidia bacterium]